MLPSVEAGGFVRTDFSIPGFGPAVVEVGDFNGDKKIDLSLAVHRVTVTTSRYCWAMAWGSLATPKLLPLADQPTQWQ